MVKQIENNEIVRIISTEKIQNQNQLLEKIEGLGYSMTQSSLSKRLAKLRVKKKHGIYVLSNTVEVGLRGLLNRIDEAPPNLLVLHTPPGHAQALAFQLDYISAKDPNSIVSLTDVEDTGFPEIIGTIAGDDTVLVVTSPDKLGVLKEKLQQFWY